MIFSPAYCGYTFNCWWSCSQRMGWYRKFVETLYNWYFLLFYCSQLPRPKLQIWKHRRRICHYGNLEPRYIFSYQLLEIWRNYFTTWNTLNRIWCCCHCLFWICIICSSLFEQQILLRQMLSARLSLIALLWSDMKSKFEDTKSLQVYQICHLLWLIFVKALKIVLRKFVDFAQKRIFLLAWRVEYIVIVRVMNIGLQA